MDEEKAPEIPIFPEYPEIPLGPQPPLNANKRLSRVGMPSFPSSANNLEAGALQEFISLTPITLKRSNTKKSTKSLKTPKTPSEGFPLPRRKQNILAPATVEEKEKIQPWKLFSQIASCCFPSSFLIRRGVKEAQIPAWREKFALCFIIFILCCLLAFMTFWLQDTLCPPNTVYGIRMSSFNKVADPNDVVIQGKIYNIASILETHSNLPYFVANKAVSEKISTIKGIDISPFFPQDLGTTCSGILKGSISVSCQDPVNFPGIQACHSPSTLARFPKMLKSIVYYTWEDITANQNLVIFNNQVLNIANFPKTEVFGSQIDSIIRNNPGVDITVKLSAVPNGAMAGKCLEKLYNVGQLEVLSVGCITSQIIVYISLVIISALIIIRFTLAVWFRWFISMALGKLEKNRTLANPQRRSEISQGNFAFAMNDGDGLFRASVIRAPQVRPEPFQPPQQVYIKSQSNYCEELYTILLVTCYSESETELRNTFESLAMTDYNEDYKVLFVVADGMVKGSGNSKVTPEICLDLLEIDKNWPEPIAYPYEAVAAGSKALNYAKVYVAWFNHKGRSVPTILVVKTGAKSEANAAKPGNRGKRDSQILLMRFLQRVTLQEALCPLEYDLFQKFHYLSGVTPDHFEIVLMVDADTKVAPDSLARMVACMARDPLIMGLCGETRIANKSDSYITRIQVFEYFLSHYSTKAFESVFGGVTCLPGCFSMYRIKCPKDDSWVPILANPDIIKVYSSSVVETLHQKNLLLLGEDRFLTTMMLRTFPNRKLIFVPRAFCKTTVPHTFKMLLSQRRRWINSTIHNLMELVLVNELCGMFCFSMQFVIFVELVGTVVLPAAITFTLVLITKAMAGDVQVIPLALLGAVLGLPAILILLTTRRVVYIYWMFVYLSSLPIWNFVLPTYAFWHFDDFSWGETRKVDGENPKEAHGENDGQNVLENAIPLKRWEQWEAERRRQLVDGVTRRK